jgi:hypothetical protein
VFLYALGLAIGRVAAAVRCAIARHVSLVGILGGFVTDLLRTRKELLVENALLRQQLIVAARHIKRPRFRPTDRALLVVFAAWLAR